jgi:hypothetical protein
MSAVTSAIQGLRRDDHGAILSVVPQDVSLEAAFRDSQHVM